jgi:hypothetical protein
MTTRRGLGKGLGCGYKNLVYKDPYIHGLSAKGVKTMPYLRKVYRFEGMNPDYLSDELKGVVLEVQKKKEHGWYSQPYVHEKVSNVKYNFNNVLDNFEKRITDETSEGDVLREEFLDTKMDAKGMKSFYQLKPYEKEEVVAQFFVDRFGKTPQQDPDYYSDWVRRAVQLGNPIPFMDKKSVKVWNKTLQNAGLKKQAQIESKKTGMMETVDI